MKPSGLRYGTKETEDIILAAGAIMRPVIEARKAGKLTLWQKLKLLWSFIKKSGEISKAIEGAGTIPKELADLSGAELDILGVRFVEQCGAILPDDERKRQVIQAVHNITSLALNEWRRVYNIYHPPKAEQFTNGT